MRIGEVATHAGVNPQTLRYYERIGLLPKPVRSRSGYRAYPQDAVRVVKFIKRSQELGFTRAQWMLLNTIDQHEGLRQTTLADLTELGNAAIGRPIDGLERGGWVEEPCTDFVERLDGHAYHTHCTPGRPCGHVVAQVIPPGHVFLAGDHRDHSADSRVFGPVPVDRIKGRAWVALVSWGRRAG